MEIKMELFEPVSEVYSHKQSSSPKDARNIVGQMQVKGGRSKTKAATTKHCTIATHPMAEAKVIYARLQLVVVGKNKLPLGRPWIIWLIDQRTRMPLGFHVSFDPPSAMTFAQCLKNAIPPKSYVKESYPDICNEWACFGVPIRIIFEPSMEFVDNDIREMASALGFHAEFIRTKNAWHEGFIERFLWSTNQLFAQYTGKTFSHSAERCEHYATDKAMIAYGELLHFVHKWVIDDYAQTQDHSLNDSPSKVWNREIVNNPIRPLPDLAHLDASLCRIAERVLSREGIEFENTLPMKRATCISFDHESSATPPILPVARWKRQGMSHKLFYWLKKPVLKSA